MDKAGKGWWQRLHTAPACPAHLMARIGRQLVFALGGQPLRQHDIILHSEKLQRHDVQSAGQRREDLGKRTVTAAVSPFSL